MRVDGSRFIVTGTGRSGTLYCTHLLRAQGLRVGHESVYRWHRFPWQRFQGDVSWLAVPYLEAGDKPGPIVHVVRDPRHTIRSSLQIGKFTDRPTPWVDFAREHCPEAWRHDDPFTRACAFWVDWNERAARLAHVTLRVEDLTAATLLAAIDQGEAIDVPPPPSDTHRRIPFLDWPVVEWSDLPARVVRLAERYGYGAGGGGADGAPRHAARTSLIP